MRTTGMVRRIDELGRVVIPKEIRRTMRLKVGEELEIFVGIDNELVFKKYSTLDKFNELAAPYVEALAETIGRTVIVTDNDKVLAVSGERKRDFKDKAISARVERIMLGRKSVVLAGENCINISGEEFLPAMEIFTPIVVCGDVVGCIIIISEFDSQGANEVLLAETAAGFFSKLNQ